MRRSESQKFTFNSLIRNGFSEIVLKLFKRWEIWWVGKKVIPLRRNFVVIVMTPLSQCKGIL